MATKKKPTTRKSEPPNFKGVAVVTRTCFLGGKEYKFEVGKIYNIGSKEVFTKLTNKDNRVLEEVEK